MRRLRGSTSIPWLIGGDFNGILQHGENKGGRTKADKLINDFSSVVDDCNLIDMGFSGDPYTWCNRRPNGQTVYERIDRILCNSAGLSNFPNNSIEHLDYQNSDHQPVVLHVDNAPIRQKNQIQEDISV